MATEIELKYLIVNDNVVELISTLLADNQISNQQTVLTLENYYFDTPQHSLRQCDIGLRVRSSNGQLEQTIKTAGKAFGGLHQRPEYNVSIAKKTPDLSLFPQEIWPTSLAPEEVQVQLIPLFSTNFRRVVWLLTNDNGSQIELVFDCGSIEVNKLNEPINEIELELISGELNDLFKLATLLVDHLSIRAGIKSKAARGYALLHQQTKQSKKAPVKITPLELIPLEHQYQINQSFSAGLQFSLNQLQRMIEIYCTTPSLKVLVKITELLALIRHGFWLFQDYLSASTMSIRSELSKLIKELSWVENAIYFQELTDKTGNYRNKIAYSEQLITQLKLEKSRFPEPAQVLEILHSARFNLVQLSLLKLLLSLEGEQRIEADFEKDLLTFSQEKLAASLTLLTSHLMQSKGLSLEEYLSQQKLLIRSLLTGSWCGSLYNKVERLEFRDPWLDVKQGMDELHTLLILKQQLATISGQQAEKIHRWMDSKVDSLLLALDCSRKNALTINPYWN